MQRRGLGQFCHLAVSDLWVQQKLQEGVFRLEKLNGKLNPADALTKHIPRPPQQTHGISQYGISGRASDLSTTAPAWRPGCSTASRWALERLPFMTVRSHHLWLSCRRPCDLPIMNSDLWDTQVDTLSARRPPNHEQPDAPRPCLSDTIWREPQGGPGARLTGATCPRCVDPWKLPVKGVPT